MSYLIGKINTLSTTNSSRTSFEVGQQQQDVIKSLSGSFYAQLSGPAENMGNLVPTKEYNNCKRVEIKVLYARLVIPVILGKWRVWWEIQNLYMRFVILEVINPLLCTV